MNLRAVAPCLVAVACLSACGTAADLAGVKPASERVDPTSAPTEPSPTSPTESSAQTPTTPPTTQQTTPTDKPEDRPPKELPHVVGGIKFFTSPSKNIGCLITRTSVRCDIKEKSYREPARPASCGLDYGKALQVGRAGRQAGFACVGDTVLGARQVLRYHSSTEVGDFGCTSRESGMTCYNLRTRHGFLISREVVDLF